LSATARRAGWVGCNFALDRIPIDARIRVSRSSSDRQARRALLLSTERCHHQKASVAKHMTKT
jgi:hypothetical protein